MENNNLAISSSSNKQQVVVTYFEFSSNLYTSVRLATECVPRPENTNFLRQIPSLVCYLFYLPNFVTLRHAIHVNTQRAPAMGTNAAKFSYFV